MALSARSNYYILCVRVLRSFIYHVKENTDNFFSNERNRPLKHIHVIRQDHRMLCTAVLFYIKTVVHKLNYGSFISINVTIVRC